ncbi:MAG: hypothetical protein HBSAPP04_22970 [Ignavibacteriaceae bacterium]|nr:MAG: hypothetical protein HBSAPP04_22970 [Ignavibacteriaceae bacterium]
MIKIAGLAKNYKKLRALDSVSVELREGAVTAIVGPNGSGKTTLLKSILGLVIPDSGAIDLNGTSIFNNNEFKRLTGYLPQYHGFPANLTVKESVDLLKHLRSDSADHDLELYHKFGLPEHEKKQIKQLSGGTLQKLSASIAFMFRPKFLVLDEPTASLDPWAADIFKEKVRQENRNGVTVLLTSHIMPEVEELADEVIFLLEGRVHFHGGVEELKSANDSPTLEKAVAGIMGREFKLCTA